ncbi:MAG: TetR/AcrR family transcriptional regulator [Actinomycetota bacterium]|nr:TetR/AcrR family transcriptional regulator [Actinomycetota bacterium]
MATEAVRKKRRPHRRDEILAAAVGLFHERGYHATGMDEIGAAAGMTGPGIYRHFRNKEEILETLIRQQGEAVLAEVERAAESSGEASAVVDALVHTYVDGIVAEPSLAVVAMFERGTLSPETRRWIDRMERRNVDLWVEAVHRARPDLTEAETRVVVHAALTMGVTVCNYNSGLEPDHLARILRPMVRAALG